MPSIRSRIVRLILRHLISKADKKATLQQRRATLEDGARRLPMPPRVDVQQTTVGNIPAEWLRPADTTDNQAILYLHGGAYTMGSCATHRALASRIAIASKTPALQPEYRLAPEHPFPAALQNCVAAYRWLVDHGIPPRRIVVAGDSAGAGLALALAVTLRDDDVPIPAAIVCISPWADLELTGESLGTHASVDLVCSLEDSRFHAVQYVGKADPRTALVSPVYADLHGLPPILIHVGDREILLSDALRLAERARGDGVDVELKVWEGMWHVWPLLAGYVPEGQRAVDEIGAFISKHIDCGRLKNRASATADWPDSRRAALS
jgi:acetyl esterase/lipase